MEEVKNLNELKCIKENCPWYFESDQYIETCQLISKYIMLDRCYGINEIPNKKKNTFVKLPD